MVVENTTVISGENARIAVLRSGRKEFFTRYVFGALLTIFGLIVLFIGLPYTDWNYIAIGGMFSAFGLAYLIITSISLAKMPKKKEKENSEVFEFGMTFFYKFKEQSINIVSKTNSKTVKIEYAYTEVKKVIDVGDEYYLYTKDGIFYYVRKEAFAEPKDKMIEFFKKNLSLHKKKIKVIDKK